MKGRIFSIFLLLIASGVSLAEQTEIDIHGKQVSCMGLNRMSVSFNESASTTEKIKASYISLFGYVITLDPKYLKSLPPEAALFTVYHECAHTGLSIGVKPTTEENEVKADCYAINKMKELGYISDQRAFNKSMITLMDNGSVHGFNSKRVKAIEQCLKDIKTKK